MFFPKDPTETFASFTNTLLTAIDVPVFVFFRIWILTLTPTITAPESAFSISCSSTILRASTNAVAVHSVQYLPLARSLIEKQFFFPVLITSLNRNCKSWHLRDSDTLQAKDKRKVGIHEAPLYKVKKRTGLNYIATFPLKTDEPSSKWTLRGVALLCSLD